MFWRRVRARCNLKLLKGAVALLVVSIVVFIVASSVLYDNHRRLNYSVRAQASCRSCPCVCPSTGQTFPSASDCGESSLDMIKEQLGLQETVAKETMGRTEASTEGTKKTSLRFRVEAEKCNAGVAACELGRERAEAQVMEEHRLAALWEKRARERGWKDSDKVYLYR